MTNVKQTKRQKGNKTKAWSPRTTYTTGVG